MACGCIQNDLFSALKKLESPPPKKKNNRASPRPLAQVLIGPPYLCSQLQRRLPEPAREVDVCADLEYAPHQVVRLVIHRQQEGRPTLRGVRVDGAGLTKQDAIALWTGVEGNMYT